MLKSQIDLSDITYMKSETKRDIELEDAFSKLYDLERGVDKVRYYYNRIDLNNDNVPETFVYLTGPSVCGTGGCSAAIFQRVNNQYKLVSRFSLVRTPIIIRDKMTNGWKNIIMHVSGGGIEPGYKELIFNGKIKGIGIISDDLSKNRGIAF